MKKGVNKVILIGNLGKDPDVKDIGNGHVANISIATSEDRKDKTSGEYVEHAEWHRVVLFNKTAEIAGKYLRKGSKVYIEGKIQTRKWNKDGVDMYTTEILANEMQMLDSKSSAKKENSTQDFFNDDIDF